MAAWKVNFLTGFEAGSVVNADQLANMNLDYLETIGAIVPVEEVPPAKPNNKKPA